MTFTPVQNSPRIETPDPTELLIKEARQKTRRRRTRYVLVALVAVAAVVAVAASNNFGRAVPRTSSVESATDVATGSPRCSASQLRVSSLGAPGGSLHDGVIVRVRNVSTDACSLSGYASAQGINRWNGGVLTATQTRNSYLGGWNSSKPVPTVALRAKTGFASFLVTAVDTAITNPSCPNLTTLRVTIPPSSAVFTMPTYLNACRYFQVHPFVPGATGTSP